MITKQIGEKPNRYILFVDDEPKSTKYFEKIFSKNFNILTANNANDAFEIISSRHNDIAVIITDQRMPNFTGVDLLNKVKNAYPNIIRILTTAHSSLEDSILAINQCNIFAYLTKPWDIDEMSLILHNGFMELEARIALLGLSGSIAHEMRNPLNSIANSFEMVKILLPKKPSEDDQSAVEIKTPNLLDIHDIIDESKQTIKRGNKIIDSILANSRGEEIDNSNFTKLSARDVVKFATRNFGYENLKDQKLIEIIGGDFDFLGDKDLFIYVLFNLIKNSLYYKTQKNNFKITINIVASPKENYIKVKDNGVGVPQDKLENIFDNFSSSGKKGGTGLGLSFCRRVLKSFGSSIKCDSVLGEWTEFTISFPLYDSYLAQKILNEIKEKKKDSAPALPALELLNPEFTKGKTILLADDDLVASKMTGRILSTLGFAVIHAHNGQVVLEILDQRSPDSPIDLILMDIEMPVMNGIEASKIIRQGKYGNIPIIASTADTSKDRLRIIKDAGINDVLGKPFFKEEFFQILAQWFKE